MCLVLSLCKIFLIPTLVTAMFPSLKLSLRRRSSSYIAAVALIGLAALAIAWARNRSTRRRRRDHTRNDQNSRDTANNADDTDAVNEREPNVAETLHIKKRNLHKPQLAIYCNDVFELLES